MAEALPSPSFTERGRKWGGYGGDAKTPMISPAAPKRQLRGLLFDSHRRDFRHAQPRAGHPRQPEFARLTKEVVHHDVDDRDKPGHDGRGRRSPRPPRRRRFIEGMEDILRDWNSNSRTAFQAAAGGGAPKAHP